MKKIAVHLAEGFEEIEAVSIIDVLRRADFDVEVVSISDNPEVTGSHQIKITADRIFKDIDYKEVEMIVLPGGMPGANNLNAHQGLRQQIKKFYKENKPIGAICAAPIVLGDMGILKNKTATCYPGYEDRLTGANTTGASVEQDNNIITGRGAGVAIQFALKIVEFFKDKQQAENLAEKMVMENFTA